jgi:predicted amidohydrolase YtcJ
MSCRHNRFEQKVAFCLAGLVTFASPALAQTSPKSDAAQPAIIYDNGTIITMEGDRPKRVQVVVEQGGQIAFAGRRTQARRQFPTATRRDLNGQTLVPGFIDGHGHLYLTGFSGQMASVLPSPDGPGTDFDAVVNTTRTWMTSEAGKRFIATFGWVIANGYDDSQLRERASPTAEVLDRISTEYPVMVIHQSGHIAALNTRGLATAGFSRDTPNPEGGILRRKDDGSPNGVIEEAALTNLVNGILSKTTAAFDDNSIRTGQQLYIRHGYTTAQEGRAFPNITAALTRAAEAKKLDIDVVSYPDINLNVRAMTSSYYRSDFAYSNHYRIGGVKIILDGSPQAMTAWLSQPYFHPSHGHAADYRGYPTLPDARSLALFEQAARNGWQIMCHANGDAAIDLCLNSIDQAQQRVPNPNHRSVIIHGQTMRADQVLRTANLRALPSFFAAHTFYWGDYHRDTVLGPQRAARISPTRDALKAGLTLTSHHDSPVIPPDAMRVLDATVNRTTRSGVVLGPDQRLTPYEGLQALTIWAAYQHFEEGHKGSLSVGKLADMVVLSANPLTVPRGEIDQIRVTATIKEGRTLLCDTPNTFCGQ